MAALAAAAVRERRRRERELQRQALVPGGGSSGSGGPVTAISLSAGDIYDQPLDAQTLHSTPASERRVRLGGTVEVSDC